MFFINIPYTHAYVKRDTLKLRDALCGRFNYRFLCTFDLHCIVYEDYL